MDKYEYKVRSEEISKLIDKEKYAEAVKIADTIDWRRVKSATMLLKIAALYRVSRRNEDSREMLMLAYDRYPTNRSVVYSLCELSIELDDVVAAIEYYKQFVKLAPKDNGVYTLRYRILEAQEASLEERIEILEELKKKDYQEEWAYELAYLYHRVGLSTKCVEECDDIILWFGDGAYVMKAMELKAKHVPLTDAQLQNYNIMLGNAGQDYSSGSYDTGDYAAGDYNAGGYDSQNYDYSGEGYDNQNYDPNYSGESYDNQNYDANYNGAGYDDQNYDANYSGAGYDASYSGTGYDSQNYDADYNGAGYDGQNYDPNYGNENYDSQNYDPNYSDEGYDGQNYNTAGYDDQNYSSEGYGEQNYSGAGYDGQGYAADGYNAENYDGQSYGAGNSNGLYASEGGDYPNGQYANGGYGQQYAEDGYAQNNFVDDGYGNLSYIDSGYQDNGYTGEFYVEQAYDENGNLIDPKLYTDNDHTQDNYPYAQSGQPQEADYTGQTNAPREYRNGLHLVENPAPPAASSSDMSQYNTINLQKVVAESMKELFPDDNEDVFAEDREKYNSGETVRDNSGDTRIFAGVNDRTAGAQTTGRVNVAQMVTGVSEAAPEPNTGAIKMVLVPGGNARSIKSDSNMDALRDTTEQSVEDEHARMESNDENVYHIKSLMDTDEDGKASQAPTGPMKLDEVLVEWERMKQDNARQNQEQIQKRLLTQTGKIFADFDNSIRSGILGELEREEAEAEKKNQKRAARKRKDGFLDADITGDIPQQPASDDDFDVSYVTEKRQLAKQKRTVEPEDLTVSKQSIERSFTEEAEMHAVYGTDTHTEEPYEEGEADAGTVNTYRETADTEAAEQGGAFGEETLVEDIGAHTEEIQVQDTDVYSEEADADDGVYSEEANADDVGVYSEEADADDGVYSEEANADDVGVYSEEADADDIGVYGEETDTEEAAAYDEESHIKNTDANGEKAYVEDEDIDAEEDSCVEAITANNKKADTEEAHTKNTGAYSEINDAETEEEAEVGDSAAYGEEAYMEDEDVTVYGEASDVEDAAPYDGEAYVQETDEDDKRAYRKNNKTAKKQKRHDKWARKSVPGAYTEEIDVTDVYTGEAGAYDADLPYTEEDDYPQEDSAAYADAHYENDLYENNLYDDLEDAYSDTFDESHNTERRRNEQYNERDLDPEDAESIAEMAKEDALKTQEIKMNTADLSALSDKIVATTKKEASGARREEIRDFTAEEQNLFENFAVTKKIKKQIIYALENMTLAAYTGNVIITGDAGLDTMRMAKNLIKEYQASDESFSGKLAKITGEKINQRNIKDIFAKLNNGGMIIEKANGMSEEKLYELAINLNQDTLGIVVIMEDTKKEITKLLEKQAMIVDYFNIRVDLMEMDTNALVAYAKNYALALEYSIDELGTLALFTRITNMQSGNHVVTKDEVRDIIDEAIWKSKKSKIKNFVDVLFARRYDDEDMIVLKERDFM